MAITLLIERAPSTSTLAAFALPASTLSLFMHPKANYSLAGTNHPHVILLKNIANQFRLATSVLLMA